MTVDPVSEPGGWRSHVLPDGKVAEFVDARWGVTQDDDPPGTVPVVVTMSVDGVLQDMRLLVTSEQMEANLDG